MELTFYWYRGDMTSVPDPPVSFSSSSAYIQCSDAKGAGWERPCILSPPTWPSRGSIHLLRAGDLAMEGFRCCGHTSWNLCLEQFSTKVGSLFFPSMWLWSTSEGMARSSGGGLRRHKDWAWEAAHMKTDRQKLKAQLAPSITCCLSMHSPEMPRLWQPWNSPSPMYMTVFPLFIGTSLLYFHHFVWTLPIKHCWFWL